MVAVGVAQVFDVVAATGDGFLRSIKEATEVWVENELGVIQGRLMGVNEWVGEGVVNFCSGKAG